MGRKAKYIMGDEAIWVATFSNNLRFIIRNKKTSAAAIARKLGIPVHHMQAYARGSARPSDEMVCYIAEALGCKVADLLDEEGNPWNFGKSIHNESDVE